MSHMIHNTHMDRAIKEHLPAVHMVRRRAGIETKETSYGKQRQPKTVYLYITRRSFNVLFLNRKNKVNLLQITELICSENLWALASKNRILDLFNMTCVR